MFGTFFRDIHRIAKELHTANVIDAERNALLEYLIPADSNPSSDLMPLSREYIRQIHLTEKVCDDECAK